MNIIIPMAGAGQRFADEGYKISKPAIPTTDRRTGKEIPMVVCATKDLPYVQKDGTFVPSEVGHQSAYFDLPSSVLYLKIFTFTFSLSNSPSK